MNKKHAWISNWHYMHTGGERLTKQIAVGVADKTGIPLAQM